MTYRELPTGWDSLLEPRWKGRVAVPDPLKSDMAASVLTEAAKNSEKERISGPLSGKYAVSDAGDL